MQKTKYLCALVLAIIAMFPGTVQAKEKVEVPEEVIAISEELGGEIQHMSGTDPSDLLAGEPISSGCGEWRVRRNYASLREMAS